MPDLNPHVIGAVGSIVCFIAAVILLNIIFPEEK